MKRWVVVMLLAGCDSSEGEPAPAYAPPAHAVESAPTAPATIGAEVAAKCQAPAGAYLVRYAVQGGDCEPIADAMVTFPATGGAATNCSGSSMASVDRCRVTTDFQCVGEDGATIERNVVITWSKDGSAASGSLRLTRTAPTAACLGMYAMTYTRQ